jgi:hypothetical protein
MVRWSILLCALCCLAVTSQAAVTLGQVDDFEDGATMGWFVPQATHPAPPENIATGGPGGADDNFLRLRAFGNLGAGSRLSVLSDSHWGGNYVLTGVSHIAMDVNNFGPDSVSLRLLFEDLNPTPGPPLNLALSATAVEVPANSGWMRIVFAVRPADLIGGGLGTVQGALENADLIRIFHNPAAQFPGPPTGPPPVTVTLGVDNITAAQIPEPRTLWTIGMGLVAGSFVSRRFGREN